MVPVGQVRATKRNCDIEIGQTRNPPLAGTNHPATATKFSAQAHRHGVSGIWRNAVSLTLQIAAPNLELTPKLDTHWEFVS